MEEIGSRGGPRHADRADSPGLRRRQRLGDYLLLRPRRLRRHGDRLRGDPGIAGPARGLEDAPLPSPRATRTGSSGSGARPAPRPGCTTPTSCRSSASASTTACTTTPCSSSAGQGLDAVLREVKRLRRDPSPHPVRAGTTARSRRSPWRAACVRPLRGRRREVAGADGARGQHRGPDGAATIVDDVALGPSSGDRSRSVRPARGSVLSAAWRGSASRWPRPWSMPISRASSTATSSRPTCCSTPRARSGSPTSAWPRPRTATS